MNLRLTTWQCTYALAPSQAQSSQPPPKVGCLIVFKIKILPPSCGKGRGVLNAGGGEQSALMPPCKLS
jgi:pyrimidine deaminase RibD-like protein